jgi:hypothetical protein
MRSGDQVAARQCDIQITLFACTVSRQPLTHTAKHGKSKLLLVNDGMMACA